MKKYLMIAAAGVALAAPAFLSAPAVAEDATMEATHEAEAVEHTLEDGTVVHVKGDHVTVVGVDGTETPAPDGVHTLEDGTTIETHGGMIVHGDAEADHDAETEMDH